MADVSDERLAKILDKAEKQSAIDSVTIGRVSTLWIESEDLRRIVLELQARRAADAKNGVGGTVAGCRERLCHSSDPHCQWPACHTARAALGARDD